MLILDLQPKADHTLESRQQMEGIRTRIIIPLRFHAEKVFTMTNPHHKILTAFTREEARSRKWWRED